MKSFLVIGMSTFGQHLCKELNRAGGDVMIADADSAAIEPMLQYSISAKIGDCTNIEVLNTFGVDEFDVCFVCVGGNFSEGLEITYLLKELGAKKVISEVNRDIESKFLLRNGADSVVYPEKDLARRIAAREISSNIFDAISLSDGYYIYEIETPEKWLGKTVKDMNVRVKFNLSIIAVKLEKHIQPMLSAEYVFKKEDHLIVLGHENDIKKVTK